jgi:hypothetical protein
MCKRLICLHECRVIYFIDAGSLFMLTSFKFQGFRKAPRYGLIARYNSTFCLASLLSNQPMYYTFNPSNITNNNNKI